jgi:protein TonB
MTRERLLTSIALALVVHALAFMLLELFLKFQSERLPEYSGPLFVQLEEQPVVQRARESAALPAVRQTAAAAEAGEAPQAVTRTGEGQAAAQPIRPAAGEPPKPKGPQFRMEGAPAQVEAAQTLPSGQGFQVPSEEPTLPPSGLKSQGAPLRAETVSPQGETGQAPALPLESVDRALSQAGGTKGGAAGTAAASPAGGASGQAGGTAQTAHEGISILWEDPAQGRETTFTPRPVIPKWVSDAGLRLTVEVNFVLTPQGVLSSVRIQKSSGYSDVDSSVLEALRRWKFKPVAGRTSVKGRVGYLILPR